MITVTSGLFKSFVIFKTVGQFILLLVTCCSLLAKNESPEASGQKRPSPYFTIRNLKSEIESDHPLNLINFLLQPLFGNRNGGFEFLGIN